MSFEIEQVCFWADEALPGARWGARASPGAAPTKPKHAFDKHFAT